MKLEFSQYLQGVKPCLKELLKLLLEDYAYVSILATDIKGKVYRTSKTGSSIKMSPMISERGFVLKVYDGKGYCEYSFNEIKEESILEIVERVKKQLVPLTEALEDIVSQRRYAELEEESCILSCQAEVKLHPEDLGDKIILERLQNMSQQIRESSEKIIDAITVFEYAHVSKMFLSEQKDMMQSFMWSDGALMGIAADQDISKEYYNSYSGWCGAELLEEMAGGTQLTSDTVLELLKAQPVKPGIYDVICDSEVTGLIAHEAFGHGVEMDMFVKNRALAQQYMGEYVASPLITMHDGAQGVNDTGSYFFDDEGILAQDTIIIDKGILKRGLSDTQTAMHLGTLPTGNGRRESYERKAYTRMTNTYFERGSSSIDEMIESISDGILLQGYMSGMEDPKNWGIQCMITIGREIKNGRLTGKIYSPIVMTGYVPDLLKSISMVSKDSCLYGAGYCGKGYKEFVKTSIGGPAIKAKVRLG